MRIHVRLLVVGCLLYCSVFAKAQSIESQADVRVALEQIVISANFDTLDKNISRASLLAVAEEKRKQFPDLVSYSQLLEIKDSLTSHLRKNGYKFHIVKLPVQKLSRGYVTFSVISVTLDDVSLGNSTAINDNAILSEFDGLLNQPVYQPNIDTALAALRTNPLLKVFAYYSRGEAQNSVRLNIKLKPRRDFINTLSFDNYGSRAIGEERLLMQTQWLNPTSAMDKLNLTLLFSNGDEINTFGYLSYLRPIWGLDHRIRLSASNNVFQLGDELATLDLNGDVTILGAHFEKDLANTESFSNTITVNHEQRETSYTGFLEDELSESSTLNSLNFKVSRNKSRNTRHHFVGTYARGSSEKGQNSERSFDLAKLNYKLVITPESLLNTRLASRLIFDFRSQYTEENVSSFDQFSLTGVNGVRAFRPGQFAVDKGYLLKAEWHLSKLVKRKSSNWLLTPFVSLDVAQGEKLDETGAVLERGEISGIATGISVNHKSGFSSKLSFASTINKDVSIISSSNQSNSQRELENSGALFEMLYRW